MLFALSIMGVVMVGLMADALLFERHEDSDETDESDLVDDDGETANGDLLDDFDRNSDDAGTDHLVGGADTPLTVAGPDQSGISTEDWLVEHRGTTAVETDALGDTVQDNDGDDASTGGTDSDPLCGDVGGDSIDGSYSGGAGADTLAGNDADNWIYGGDGDDWLVGGAGNDHLFGDKGADILDGGNGNDTLSGREGSGEWEQVDYLNGEDGDDVLFLGAGDQATGGGGSDTFVLQGSAVENAVARVLDYDQTHDKLIVNYDPSVHPDPVLAVEPNDDGTEHVVFLDGSKLAIVHGDAVDPLSIRLVAT